jgi:hypothetical protein
MRDTIEIAREAGVSIRGHYDETGSTPQELERLVALVRADEREAVIGLLRGIDETETECADGWWETSAGAEFGAGRIAAIRARGETK